MAALTAYECLVFQDGKIKVLHKQADYVRDATPEEIWAYIAEIETDKEELRVQISEAGEYYYD